MEKVMVKEMTEGTKQKVLIHGVLEKKTFLTYALYYFIVYEDLSIRRIKCESLEKEKVIKIKYKTDMNMSSSLKLVKS